ncbi:hypothetical protein GCM10023238_01500 [Streptomyces heliomycini]
MDAVTVLTEPGTEGTVEVRVPGGVAPPRRAVLDGRHRACGPATIRWTPSGATGADASGAAPGPLVRDAPAASLGLSEDRADTDIGGAPA